MLGWRTYQSDLGRVYPMFALNAQQVNNTASDIDPVELLPPIILANLIEVKNFCAVDSLTPRTLILWTSEGSQFVLNYPNPFTEALKDYLTLNINVAAFEFVGEKLKYGRLRRMLENV
jgi:hypothetical protein